MATDAENIATIKSQTLALITSLTLNPKPTYTIDGQTVSWGDYLKQLRDTVAWCDQQLQNTSPFEITSMGCT